MFGEHFLQNYCGRGGQPLRSESLNSFAILARVQLAPSVYKRARVNVAAQHASSQREVWCEFHLSFQSLSVGSIIYGSPNACKGVFNPNVTFPSNWAEGLHFSAFH